MKLKENSINILLRWESQHNKTVSTSQESKEVSISLSDINQNETSIRENNPITPTNVEIENKSLKILVEESKTPEINVEEKQNNPENNV